MASVIDRPDAMVVRYGTEQLVTLAYAVAATDTLTMTNAGPPPSLVRADGAVQQFAYADGPPLGMSQSPRGERTIRVSTGDTLFAFTDRLIERRNEDIDDGLARLAHAVPAWAHPDVTTGLQHVVQAVIDQTYDDDVAALALRGIG